MVATTSLNLKELYEIDDYLWIQEIVKLLKEQKFQELDLDNLIEELEDLGSEKRNAVESLLEQIIRHLLLLEYWTDEYERNANHWEAEIVGFRNQINSRMTTNFYNHLRDNLASIHKKALRYAQKKTRLNNLL